MRLYLNDTVAYKKDPSWIINGVRADEHGNVIWSLYNKLTGASMELPENSPELSLVKRGDPIIDYLDDIGDDSEPTYTALFRFYQRIKKHCRYGG